MVDNMKFTKGTIPWNKGFTKKNNEIIKRIGETNKEKLKGRHLSKETKLKISEKLKISHTRKSWGFLKNDSKTISMARRGGKNSPTKFKKGTSIRNTGRTRFKKGEYRVVNNPVHFKSGHRKPQNAFSFPKGNQYAKGRKKSPNAYKFPRGNPYRFKVGIRNNSRGEFKVGDPRHKDVDIQTKRIKNLLKAPNKKELFLNNFLRTNFPNEFKYAGGGSILIGNKCPDFVSINGKKRIIELFGTYWHDQKRRKLLSHQTESGTMEYYEKHGFKCLVIWESELKDLNSLFIKIKKFIADGGQA